MERKDVTKTDWIIVGKTDKLEVQAPKLLEGKKYVFKVSAENDVGSGPAVESSPHDTAQKGSSEPPSSALMLYFIILSGWIRANLIFSLIFRLI